MPTLNLIYTCITFLPFRNKNGEIHQDYSKHQEHCKIDISIALHIDKTKAAFLEFIYIDMNYFTCIIFNNGYDLLNIFFTKNV